MRRFCAGLTAALLCCAALLFFQGIDKVNDTPVNPDGSINIPSDGSRYIPTAGDIIRCDDRTNYAVLDASLYADPGPLPSISQEWPASELPEGEAVHYEDGSGNYLFIRNMRETLRLAYTACGAEGGTKPLHIRLTIPEDISSDAFSPWNPARVLVLSTTGRGDTICLEAWDMFKNGVYYKTLYEIGIDRGEFA